MNALQKTLAIIAFLILASQTTRHAYRLWLEPRGSVLDKYDQPLKGQIENAGSLEELLSRYDKVRQEVNAKRQELLKIDMKDRPMVDEFQTEPYRSERALRDAITDWERKSQEIRELRFYWLAGFSFFVAGLFAYRKLNRWFGLTLLIAGLAEFIYWTSPTLLGPSTREFDRLLANKLAFSVASLGLLIAVIWFNRIFFSEGEQAKL